MQRFLSITLLTAFIGVIVGCGGGGGGGAAAPAGTLLEGTWTSQAVAPAPPAPKFHIWGGGPIPEIWTFSFENGTITGRTDLFTCTGTISGNDITITSTSGGTTYTLTATIADGQSFGGTLRAVTAGSDTTTQLTFTKAAQPNGTLTSAGTINGVDIATNSTSAFAVRSSADATKRTLYHMTHSHYFKLDIDMTADLAPGTLAVTGGQIGISFEGTSGNIGDSSNGGTVTIDSVSNDRITGSYNVTSTTVFGGTASGSFDVPTMLVTN